MKIFTFLIIITLFISNGIINAGAFDSVGLHARPMAMATAFTASGDDINSVGYNPAGLAGIPELQLLFSYRDFYSLKLLSQKYVGFAIPGKILSTGLSWHRISTASRVKFIDYAENTFTLSFAGKVRYIRNLLAGVNLKFYQVLSQSNASGYGVDAGVQWRRLLNNKIDLGLFVENINRPEIIWDTGAEDRLDTNLRIGVSYKPVDEIAGSLDYGIKDRLNFGSELLFFDKSIAFRGGIKDLLSDMKIITLGIGLNFENIKFDYAMTSHKSLGLTHLFTLLIKIERI